VSPGGRHVLAGRRPADAAGKPADQQCENLTGGLEFLPRHQMIWHVAREPVEERQGIDEPVSAFFVIGRAGCTL
jgi:hypothetical protein